MREVHLEQPMGHCNGASMMMLMMMMMQWRFEATGGGPRRVVMIDVVILRPMKITRLDKLDMATIANPSTVCWGP